MKLKSKMKIAKIITFKNKPLLVLSVILLAILFSLFSLSLMLNKLDRDKIYANVLVDNDINYLSIINYDKEYEGILPYTNNDLQYIKNWLDERNINYEVPKYLVGNYAVNLMAPINSAKWKNDAFVIPPKEGIWQKNSHVYLASLVYSEVDFYEIDEASFNNLKHIGKYPKEANEVVISNFVAEILSYYGYYNATTGEDEIFPNDFEKIVNNELEIGLGEISLKVVGIYFVEDFNYEDVINFKFLYESSIGDGEFDAGAVKTELISAFPNWSRLLHDMNKYYVSEKFFDNLDFNKVSNLSYFTEFTSYYLNGDNYNILQNATANKQINSDEIIISFDTLDEMTNGDFSNYVLEVSGIEYNLIEDETILQAIADDYMKKNNIIGEELYMRIADHGKIIHANGYADYKLKIIGVQERAVNYVSEEILRQYLRNIVKINHVEVMSDDYDVLYSLLKEFKSDDAASEYWAEVPFEKETAVFDAIEKTAQIGTGVLILLIVSISFGIWGMLHLVNKKILKVLREQGMRKKDGYKIWLWTWLFILGFVVLLWGPAIYFEKLIINNVISKELLKTYQIVDFNLYLVICSLIIGLLLSLIGVLLSFRGPYSKNRLEKIK